MTYEEKKQGIILDYGTPFALRDMIKKLDDMDALDAWVISETLTELMKKRLDEAKEEDI